MRAWFRKNGRDSDLVIPEDDESDHMNASFSFPSIDSDFDDPHLGLPTRSREPPRDLHPPRPETLYISPNERDYYLSCLDAFNFPTPKLTLYAEPAPELPDVPRDPAPSFNFPHVPYPRSLSATPKPTSRGPSTAKHAILTLVDDAGIRFTGFPADALVAADESIKQAWKFGVSARSNEPTDLKLLKEPIVYRVQLKGKAWNRKGNQELESIRLLLAIFTALGRYGYIVGGSMASMGKNDTYTLLFRATPEDERPAPPLFFALTLPLPDRIALVSPPEAATDELIDSLRASILEVASDIKMEGWVHPGVYRFWIAGMRRLVGGVKNDVMTKLLPPLMVNVMDSLAALHFEWLTSIPIEPSGPGRDILIFSSTAKSGLGVKDSFSAHGVRDSTCTEATIRAKAASPALTHVAESPINAFYPSGLHPSDSNIMPGLPGMPPRRPMTQPFPVAAEPIRFLQNTNAARFSAPPPMVPPPPKRTSLDEETPARRRIIDPAELVALHPIGAIRAHPESIRAQPESSQGSDTSLLNRFPDPPQRAENPPARLPLDPPQLRRIPADRRVSEEFEQVLRNSTPGRYPSQLPKDTADGTTAPIASSFSKTPSGLGNGFPAPRQRVTSNPTLPSDRARPSPQPQLHHSASQGRGHMAPSKPRVPGPSIRVSSAPAPGPAPTHPPPPPPAGAHPRHPSGPTTMFVSSTITREPRDGKPPMHVNGFITVNTGVRDGRDGYADKDKNKLHGRSPPTTTDEHIATPRASVDSGLSTTSPSFYSSTDDHHLVTPHLNSANVPFTFPAKANAYTAKDKHRERAHSHGHGHNHERERDRERERELRNTMGVLRAPHRPKEIPQVPSFASSDLEPPTPTVVPRVRKLPPIPSPAAAGEPAPALAAPVPQLAPQLPKMDLEDLRNVRLSAAFDFENHKQSVNNGRMSVMSDFSVSTASTRPPGIGSGRARLSVSRPRK